MSEAPALLTREDDIAIVTLNRPKAGNAINLAMARELRDLARQCAEDDGIRCVVLTGSGPLFCGGGDVVEFNDSSDRIAEYLKELIDTFIEAELAFNRMNKPLVTVVNGPAAGAGFGLAILGDIVLASSSATFLSAYGGIGLTPDAGLTWLLPKLVGLRKAQELIFENKVVDAEEAERLGIVTRTVAKDELMADGMKKAKRLASTAIGAASRSRALLLSSWENDFESQLKLESTGISQSGAMAEGREGVSAYLEKRKPDFKSATD